MTTRGPLVAFVFAAAIAGHAHGAERTFETSNRCVFGSEIHLSASVRIGDMDGDGDNDVAVANGRHWPLQLADLDGDGFADIVVDNSDGLNYVFVNRPNKRWGG